MDGKVIGVEIENGPRYHSPSGLRLRGTRSSSTLSVCFSPSHLLLQLPLSPLAVALLPRIPLRASPVSALLASNPSTVSRPSSGQA